MVERSWINLKKKIRVYRRPNYFNFLVVVAFLKIVMGAVSLIFFYWSKRRENNSTYC